MQKALILIMLLAMVPSFVLGALLFGREQEDDWARDKIASLRVETARRRRWWRSP